MSNLNNNPVQNFINILNFNNITSLPFNGNSLRVATYARNYTKIKILIGEDLLKWNVEREAHRLQMNNSNIIHLATMDLWNSHLTDLQKNQFMDLADDANRVNVDYVQANDDALNRIFQMDFLQETNTPFESNIFNGVVF
ncbi:hypothetical protein RclHR1_03760011 [Rhizophagus clarus]|uniref:Uncharacterized protein n=1 Tax=Rhizophagus clarus TaxID=94130 RepID=A0A2Z6S777_9GLOM|nr:hypothetical protein RclHR1_03760011 [Rhizophagus clarus]GES79947.1 hypothetical protein GLOIN_2v1870423 [Rhizophagus clarus]